MSDNPYSIPGAEPFLSFWNDFVNKMSSAGSAPPPSPSSEAYQQMRRAFFDAMAANADKFLRSEAFLGSLKQSMDSALGWQQMFNQFLQRSLSAAQMPSRNDSEQTVEVIRGLEERVTVLLEEIAARIDRLEKNQSKGRGAKE